MIYGSLVQEKYDEYIIEYSIENFIIESDEIINNYFNEENDLIIHPDIYTANDDEYSVKDKNEKKSLVEIIKNLLNKLIITIKNLFNKFIEKIQSIYLNTNFKDKYFSRFKQLITEKNYNSAKENGWNGFTKKNVLILKLPTFDEGAEDEFIPVSAIFDRGTNFSSNFEYAKKNGQELINKILDSKSTDELNRNKKNFKNRLEVYYNDINTIIGFDNEEKYSQIRSYLNQNNYIGIPHLYNGTNWFPNNFSSLKQTIFLATEGEQNIKKLKLNNNKYLNSLKNQFKVLKNQEIDANATIYQREGFKCTLQLYQYLMKYLAFKSKIIYEIYGIYYKESIGTYITLYNGIKKYASIEKSTK